MNAKILAVVLVFFVSCFSALAIESLVFVPNLDDTGGGAAAQHWGSDNLGANIMSPQQQMVLPYTSKIHNVSLYCSARINTPTGTFKVNIVTDNSSDYPTKILANSNAQSISKTDAEITCPGWNNWSFAVPPTLIFGTYWLDMNTSQTSGAPSKEYYLAIAENRYASGMLKYYLDNTIMIHGDSGDDLSFMVWGETLISTLTNYNVTSAYLNWSAWNNNRLSYAFTMDSTPTITFSTGNNAYCAITTGKGLGNVSYVEMMSRNCSGGQGTGEHTCTVYSADALAGGPGSIYAACTDVSYDANATSDTLSIFNGLGTIGGKTDNISIELGSYVNVTLIDSCIDVSYYNFTSNIICNNVSMLNVTRFRSPHFFYKKDFNGTAKQQVLEESGILRFDMDSRTDIDLIKMNISSNGTSSAVCIQYGNRTTSHSGYLMKDVLVDTSFKYASKIVNSSNITYTNPGDNYIYLNATSVPKKWEFYLWGTQLDVGNSFGTTAYFGNASFYNITTSSASYPFWMWDEFTTNTSTRTQRYETGTGTYTSEIDEVDSRYEGMSVSSASCNAETKTDEDDVKMAFLLQNISRFKRIKFNGYCYATAGATVPSGSGSSSSSASGESYCYLAITNSNTASTYNTIAGVSASASISGTSGSDSETNTFTSEITLERVEDSGSQFSFKIYYNGVYSSTTAQLSGDINLAYIGSTYAACSRTIGCSYCPSGGGEQRSYIDSVMYSGIGNNYTVAYNYTTNSSTLAETAFSAPKDISAATVTVTQYLPSTCSITHYLSNNNGTTFERAYNGNRHVFSSTDNLLRWMANFNCTNTEDTPAILSLSIEVVPAAATNVSIDVGDDGSYEWVLNTTLNETVSPAIVLFNETNLAFESGEIPVKFTSATAGVIVMNMSSFNSTINPVVMDAPYFESCSECTFNISFSSNSIVAGNLTILYVGGNDTVSMLLHSLDYSINQTINSTMYYSGWNYSMPKYVDYLEFIPRNSFSKNVSPYGQTTKLPIFNVTMQNFGSVSANFSIKSNETYSCVNLTVSSTYNKSQGKPLNSSWARLASRLNYMDSVGVWLWADYSCNISAFRLWNPDISMIACCSDCSECSEET